MESARIFISHASQSQEEAIELVSRLRKKGITFTWIYEQDIAGGQRISERILQSVNKAAYCIFLLNEHSVVSPWCLAEVAAFWGGQKLILPYAPGPLQHWWSCWKAAEFSEGH